MLNGCVKMLINAISWFQMGHVASERKKMHEAKMQKPN